MNKILTFFWSVYQVLEESRQVVPVTLAGWVMCNVCIPEFSLRSHVAFFLLVLVWWWMDWLRQTQLVQGELKMLNDNVLELRRKLNEMNQ